MIKLFLASLLLLVSSVNALHVDVSEFFSEAIAKSSEVRDVSSSKVSMAVSSDKTSDCHQRNDSPESTSVCHHCHVGHCQFVVTVDAFLLSAPKFAFGSRFGQSSTLQSILPSAPIKPPRA